MSKKVILINAHILNSIEKSMQQIRCDSDLPK